MFYHPQYLVVIMQTLVIDYRAQCSRTGVQVVILDKVEKENCPFNSMIKYNVPRGTLPTRDDKHIFN